MKRAGFTLIELMIVIAIIATIAAIAIPALISAQRSSNERNASASFKSIATAESDFRGNDRDGNQVNDFWTGDVCGLCIIRPLDGTMALMADIPSNGIRLIESAVAGADADTATSFPQYTSQLTAPNRPFTLFGAKAGYVYFAAQADGIVAPPLRTDTDTTAVYGNVHNFDRFAFFVVPTAINVGKLAYAMAQDATIYKLPLNQGYLSNWVGGALMSSIAPVSTGDPAGLDLKNFPTNPGAQGYSKMD